MLIWMMTNNNNEGKPPLTKTVYEGLTVFFQTVFFKLYFCKVYPTCVSSKALQFHFHISYGQIYNLNL